MPKYKVLKSVAHNLAHSYFSLMHYVDGNYIMEHLFKVVREEKINEFTIDVIHMRIEPEIFMTATIRESLPKLNNFAIHLLEPNQFKLSDLESFKIKVKYDFDKTKDEIHHVYELKAIIVDKNMKEHIAYVQEWWKY